MSIPFHRHDTLRLFVEVTRYASLSAAAHALNMTKGAISYQIITLETELGFRVFDRKPRGIVLTARGQELVSVCRVHFEGLESALADFKETTDQGLTVGMSSYFAARWLSPRLMTFMQSHPHVRLRIQPMTEIFNLEQQGVDLAIRWGNGDWDDVDLLPFMSMPAWPVGNREAAKQLNELGLEQSFSQFTLLRDHDDSNAWTDWFTTAELPLQFRKDTLIIPDPNVRVQAVIDGQGIALLDGLTTREIEEGHLVRLSPVELSSYGYFLAIPRHQRPNNNVEAFIHWLKQSLG